MFDHVIESKERTIKNNLRQQLAHPTAPAPARLRPTEKAPS
jgi:hypothetical protein